MKQGQVSMLSEELDSVKDRLVEISNRIDEHQNQIAGLREIETLMQERKAILIEQIKSEAALL